VLRAHDTADPPSAYETASPIADVTFDVPGRIVDRSPTRAIDGAAPQGVGSVTGVTGKAAFLAVGATIPLDLKGKALDGFTAQAWVRPSVAGAPRALFGANDVFQLALDAADR